MKWLRILPLVSLWFIAMFVVGVHRTQAQATSTPTAVPPDVEPLPQGWGPNPPGNHITIEELTGSYFVKVINNPDLVCNSGLQLVRYVDIDINSERDPVAVAKLRVRMSYSDGGDPWAARLRFAYYSGQFSHGFQTTRCVDIYSYDSDGYTLLDTSHACYCVDELDSMCANTVYAPNLGGGDYENWRYYDNALTVNDHGYVWLVMDDLDWLSTSPHGGIFVSGLYLEKTSKPFPELCGAIMPTPSPYPTWTPYPTYTSTPITATVTPLPTSAGATSTPTWTPIPFATWTPSPSPTPWQTTMATLAYWQITPDASVTPIPTPTTYDPLPTWETWPTLVFPTIETVTPFPTLNATIATVAPLTPTMTPQGTLAPVEIYTLTNALDAQIDFTQIYSASYDLSNNISGPLRAVRGTLVTYLPALSPLVDAVTVMLFIIVAVYAIKVLLAVGGAIIKVIEVILEFVPL